MEPQASRCRFQYTKTSQMHCRRGLRPYFCISSVGMRTTSSQHSPALSVRRRGIFTSAPQLIQFADGQGTPLARGHWTPLIKDQRSGDLSKATASVSARCICLPCYPEVQSRESFETDLIKKGKHVGGSRCSMLQSGARWSRPSSRHKLDLRVSFGERARETDTKAERKSTGHNHIFLD